MHVILVFLFPWCIVSTDEKQSPKNCSMGLMLLVFKFYASPWVRLLMWVAVQPSFSYFVLTMFNTTWFTFVTYSTWSKSHLLYFLKRNIYFCNLFPLTVRLLTLTTSIYQKWSLIDILNPNITEELPWIKTTMFILLAEME